MGINKVILVGNVGRDPETRALPSGTTMCKFSLATSEPRFKDRETGEAHTEWHNIVVWGKLAEFCERYIQKGKQLYIEGRIRTRQYEKDGQTRWFTEVHADVIELLGRRGDGGPGGGGPGGGGGASSGGGFPADEDDVPF